MPRRYIIPNWSNFIGPYLKIPVLGLLPEVKEVAAKST